MRRLSLLTLLLVSFGLFPLAAFAGITAKFAPVTSATASSFADQYGSSSLTTLIRHSANSLPYSFLLAIGTKSKRSEETVIATVLMHQNQEIIRLDRERVSLQKRILAQDASHACQTGARNMCSSLLATAASAHGDGNVILDSFCKGVDAG